MQVTSSKSTYNDPSQQEGLGWVATTISAVTSIAGSVLPAVVGKSKAERRREMMEKIRRIKSAQQYLRRELDRVRRDAQDMSLREAKEIQNRGARRFVREDKLRWERKLRDMGVENPERLIGQMTEQVRQIYVDTANSKIMWENMPRTLGMTGLVLGAGVAGYSLYSDLSS